MICVDRQGRVESWSPAAEQLLGWSAQEVLGRPTSHVLAGPDGEAARALVHHLEPCRVAAQPRRQPGGAVTVQPEQVAQAVVEIPA